MLKYIKTIVPVLGCQRSGTTLTGQILGAHPKALLIDETDGLYQWFNAYSDELPELGEISAQMLRKARTKYREPDQKIIEISGEPVQIAPHITHLILKAPNLTYRYEDLARLTLPVKIIYPVRDPRPVVASIGKLTHIPMVKNQIRLINQHPDLMDIFSEYLKKMAHEETPDHIKRALMWKIKSSLYRTFKDKKFNPYLFKYETLISEPNATLHEIVKHADLTFHENMLNHQTIYQGFGPGRTSRERAIDTSSVEKWRSGLSAEQIADIIEATQDVMEDLNYLP